MPHFAIGAIDAKSHAAISFRPQTRTMMTPTSGADDIELPKTKLFEYLEDVIASLMADEVKENCSLPSTRSTTTRVASPRSSALFPRSISPKQASDVPQVRRLAVKQIAKRPVTTIGKCQLFGSQLLKQQQTKKRTKPGKRRKPVPKVKQQCYDKLAAEKKKARVENVIYRCLFLLAVYAELLKHAVTNHATTLEWLNMFEKIWLCRRAAEKAERINQMAKSMKFDDDQRSIAEKVKQDLQELLARMASEYEKPALVAELSL